MKLLLAKHRSLYVIRDRDIDISDPTANGLCSPLGQTFGYTLITGINSFLKTQPLHPIQGDILVYGHTQQTEHIPLLNNRQLIKPFSLY